jgi:4-hydroxy-tetrahydrodipicolinate synthase
MVLVQSGHPELLAAHATAISAASGLGIVFQDHPATTGVTITPTALVAAIAKAAVGVAVKAEAPPTPATVAAVSAELDLPVFGGLGGVGLLDELLAGASGAMTGFAFPEALIATVAAFRADGFEAAKGALERYLPVIVCEAQIPVGLAIRKEILRRRGLIDEAEVRPPGAALPAWAEPAIDAHLAALPAGGWITSQETSA